MQDNIVLGLAVIGGISALYTLATVAPLILGALGGAIGCGILGAIIGLVFIADSAGLVVVGCIALGFIGGLISALEKMLVVSADEYVEDILKVRWSQLSSICSGIILLISGMVGASIAGANSDLGTLGVLAGYGAGALVGSVGWFVSGKKMVYQLMLTWYMHKLKNAKHKLENAKKKL